MKIKCLRSCGASGKNLAEGKSYNVSDVDGRYLCLTGKAEQAAEKKSKK